MRVRRLSCFQYRTPVLGEAAVSAVMAECARVLEMISAATAVSDTVDISAKTVCRLKQMLKHVSQRYSTFVIP